MDPDENEFPIDRMIENCFECLLRDISNARPNDRSEKDRYFSVLKTEVEKCCAIWKTYCTTDGNDQISEGVSNDN